MTESNQGDPLEALMALQEALWKLIGEWRGDKSDYDGYDCALELEQVLSGCIPTGEQK